jgi:HD-GYP domain-containing protein (c-di-GMP phosphodiesterase class II)
MVINNPPEVVTQDPSVSSIGVALSPDLDSAAELRWHRRPLLRAALRLTAVVAPAAAAAAVAIAFSRNVSVPVDLVGTVVWWAVFAAAIVATWMLMTELLYRTLPLATLLDLTLVFPESVPSRFAILGRKMNRRQLETELRGLRAKTDPQSGPRAQFILELAVALSIHDGRTRGHSERVRMFTDLVAQELHLHPRDADRLRWAALLHDIGKLAVAPEILNKPELPDDDERGSLRNHPVEGYRMIAPLHKWLGSWAATVRDHHERFDGSGYPQGLSGRAISLGGRIVAVTDSYETMTSGRPYRKALSIKAAREELVRRSGTHFDPYVVRAFLAISLGRLWPVVGIGALIAEVPFLAPVSGRISGLGSRSVSGLAAAGAMAALIVAGLAGPVRGPLVYGPSVTRAPVAGVATQPSSGDSAGPTRSPTPTTAPTPALPSTAPGASGAPSGSNATSSSNPSSARPPSAVVKALYPAGISKRASLPPGIAKKANPFAHWRNRP